MSAATASLCFPFVGYDVPPPADLVVRRDALRRWREEKRQEHLQRLRRGPRGRWAPAIRTIRQLLLLDDAGHPAWRAPVPLPLPFPAAPRRLAMVPATIKPEPIPPCATCPLHSGCKALCGPMEAMLKGEGMPPELVQYKEKSKSPELTLFLANQRLLEESEPEPDIDAPTRVSWAEFLTATRPILEQVINDDSPENRNALTPDQRHVVREVLAGKRHTQIAREYRVVCKSKLHDPAVADGGVCPTCGRVEREKVGVKKPTISVMLKRARKKLEAAISIIFQGRSNHPVFALLHGDSQPPMEKLFGENPAHSPLLRANDATQQTKMN